MADTPACNAMSSTEDVPTTNWKLTIDNVHYLETICDWMKSILLDNPGIKLKVTLDYDWSEVILQQDDQQTPEYLSNLPLSTIYPTNEVEREEEEHGV